MPPRPALPADDLYARLEISVDASPEVIEVAWRSLLRQHHPDVAGPDRSRARQADQRRPRLAERSRAAGAVRPRARPAPIRPRHGRPRSAPGRGRRRARAGPDRPAPSRRPGRGPRPVPRPGRGPRARRDRPARLRRADADRLRRDDRPVPARRPAGRARGDGDGGRRAARPGRRGHDPAFATPSRATGPSSSSAPSSTSSSASRSASAPRERLTRGWEAAVGQPRYGPNGVAVRALIARLAAWTRPASTALAATAGRAGLDAAARRAVAARAPRPTTTRRCGSRRSWRRGMPRRRSRAAGDRRRPRWPGPAGRRARLAHLLVLRHAFAPTAFASLTRPWRPRFLPDDRPAARVRPPRPTDRPNIPAAAPVRCSPRGGVAGRDRGARRAR